MTGPPARSVRSLLPACADYFWYKLHSKPFCYTHAMCCTQIRTVMTSFFLCSSMLVQRWLGTFSPCTGCWEPRHDIYQAQWRNKPTRGETQVGVSLGLHPVVRLVTASLEFPTLLTLALSAYFRLHSLIYVQHLRQKRTFMIVGDPYSSSVRSSYGLRFSNLTEASFSEKRD